jgi:hypothetical protein
MLAAARERAIILDSSAGRRRRRIKVPMLLDWQLALARQMAAAVIHRQTQKSSKITASYLAL